MSTCTLLQIFHFIIACQMAVNVHKYIQKKKSILNVFSCSFCLLKFQFPELKQSAVAIDGNSGYTIISTYQFSQKVNKFVISKVQSAT